MDHIGTGTDRIVSDGDAPLAGFDLIVDELHTLRPAYRLLHQANEYWRTYDFARITLLC
jgi:hypothetical protein